MIDYRLPDILNYLDITDADRPYRIEDNELFHREEDQPLDVDGEIHFAEVEIERRLQSLYLFRNALRQMKADRNQ